MSKWKPIDTFPIHQFAPELWYRDGGDYLLWCGNTVIGRYGYTRKGKGRFIGPYGVVYPSHWMHLPAPPTTNDE